jgi:hypothetical protein
MKTLIALVTCKQNTGRQEKLLSTWVPLARAAGYDVEFFNGERLGVPDDYPNTRAQIRKRLIPLLNQLAGFVL